MKKITGKVVSLVLALALVVTSFSANFAFASTKSVTGQFKDGEPDTTYLVNAKDTHYGTNPTDDKVDLYTLWPDAEIETTDHQHVIDDPKVVSISHASGDKLVKWSDLDSDDTSPVANLTLRNDSVEGKEVLSVLYEGSYYDDDDNEITVKAKTTVTVYVVDEDADFIGQAPDAVADITGDAVKGSSIDDDPMDDFAVTRNSEIKLGIYRATLNTSGDARVNWTAVKAQTADADADNDPVVNAEYQVSVTTGTSDVHLGGNDGVAVGGAEDFEAVVGRTFKATAVTGVSKANSYSEDGKVGNVVITAKKIKADDGSYVVSNDSDDKLTLKGKIAKKIEAATEEDDRDLATGTHYNYLQKDGSTYLRIASDDETTQVKVPSGYEVKFGKTSVAGASVGSDAETVSVIDNASVTKVSGKVTELKVTEGTVSTVDLDAGNVTVDDSKAGNISTDGSVTIDGSDAKVGNIDADTSAAVVTVNGGTTGDIATEGTIDIDAKDEEVPVVVGAISADVATESIKVDCEDSKVTIGSIKATSAGSEIQLTGDSVTVGKVDFDHYDAALTLDTFNGNITTANTENGSITTSNDDDDNDTTATVTNAVKFDSISVGSDTNLVFGDSVQVVDLGGDGTIKFAAGKLYVTGSASGVYVKLSDATLAAGTTVFKADSDTVDVNDVTPYGFTLTKSEGSAIDTFKIDTLSFAGLQINKSVSKIAKGYSETFTVSAYPGGTAIPAGDVVAWDFDGNDDVFEVTTSGNTATIKVNSVDPDFASENEGTLTATLQDEDGYDLEDYGAATCDVTAIAVPEATSDTHNDLSVGKGASYTFKITSATAPSFTTGTAGVFTVALAAQNGNDYFYKITATGNVGAATGIYLNGTKLLVATVKSAFTVDTTKDITVKGAYTLKVTSTTTPTFGVGTAGVFKAEFVSKTGNDYFYKLTSVGAVGTKAGIYVDGTKVFVATVG